MESNQTSHSKGKQKSIYHSLDLLSEAAKHSKTELGNLVDEDYRRIMKTYRKVKPKIQDAMVEFKDATKNSVVGAVRKVDDTVHKSPWYFVGSAALITAVTGFILGRKTKRR